MAAVQKVEISVNIIHSKDGGKISYDRDTTIQRIAAFVDEAIRKRIPSDHLCSLVIAMKH